MSRLFLFSEHRYPFHQVTVNHTTDGTFQGFGGSANRYLTQEIEVVSGSAPSSVTDEMPYARSWDPRQQAYDNDPLDRSVATPTGTTVFSETLMQVQWHIVFPSHTWVEETSLSNPYTQSDLYTDWQALRAAVDLEDTTTFPRDGLTSARTMIWAAGSPTLTTGSGDHTGGEPTPHFGVQNVTEVEALYQQFSSVITGRLVLIRAPGIHRAKQWFWPEAEHGGFPQHPFDIRDYDQATLIGCTDSDVLAAGWIAVPINTSREPDVSPGNLVAKSTQLQFWRACP